VDPLCAGIYLPDFYLVTEALKRANAVGALADGAAAFLRFLTLPATRK